MGTIRTRRASPARGFFLYAVLALLAFAAALFVWAENGRGAQAIPAAGQQKAQQKADGSGGGGSGGGGASQRGSTLVKPLSAVPHRTDIAAILEKEKLQTGAELGVQVGRKRR